MMVDIDWFKPLEAAHPTHGVARVNNWYSVEPGSRVSTNLGWGEGLGAQQENVIFTPDGRGAYSNWTIRNVRPMHEKAAKTGVDWGGQHDNAQPDLTARMEKLANPGDYAEMQVNPADNAANLPAKYFEILSNMSAAQRLRFERGEWSSEVNGALWALEDRLGEGDIIIPGIDSGRVAKGDEPAMQRIVVAVDPSGTKGDGKGDDIGIVVAGLGVDGRGYVLEDATCQMSPEGWGRRAVDCYRRWNADRIIAERNYGGAMVEAVVRAANDNVAYSEVTASRGKAVRAEPIAALYEQGKIHHIGYFPELEDQLCAFTQSGYQGLRSPDRADSMIWGFTELFPGIVKQEQNAFKPIQFAV